MKEVSDGYARNYLLPRKLASEATADAVNAFKLREKAKAAQIARDRALAEENAKKLAGVVVQVQARAGQGGRLFGAVTSQEISDAPARAARHRDREEPHRAARAHQAVRQLRGEGQAGQRGKRHDKRARDGKEIKSKRERT